MTHKICFMFQKFQKEWFLFTLIAHKGALDLTAHKYGSYVKQCVQEP